MAENESLKLRIRELEQALLETRKSLDFANYTADRAEADLQKMWKKYDRAMSKVERLEKQLGAPNITAAAERDIMYFTTATCDFIRRNGGRVWSFDEFQRVSEKDQHECIKALRALSMFARQMIENAEEI